MKPVLLLPARSIALAVLAATALLSAGCATAPEPPVTPGAMAAAPDAPSRGPGDVASTAATPGEATVTPIDWARAPDCLVALRWLREAASEGRLGPGQSTPIALILPQPAPDRSWLQPASIEVAADLPIELIGTGRAVEVAGHPCVVEVGSVEDQRAEHQLIAQDQVRSLYESGVRSERNPDYEIARTRVRQLERQLKEKDAGLMMVGDPLIDLVGVMLGGLISGFGRGSREQELDEAMMELAKTPRSKDRPVYRPYHFERAVVRAGKEAIVPVTLHDRTNGQIRHARMRQRERREFVVLEGLDPRDKDYRTWRQTSVDIGELRRWLKAPPELASSALVQALLEAPGSLEEGAPPGFGRDGVETLEVALSPPAAAARGELDDRSRPRLRRSDEPLLPPSHPLVLDVDATPLEEEEPDSLEVADDAYDLESHGEDADGRLAIEFDEPLTATGPLLDGWSEPLDGGLVEVGGRGEPSDRGTPPAPAGAPDVAMEHRASVVRIVADGRAGRGFYVRSDLVLTTRRLVAGAVVVDVTTPDGTTVLGVVARTDLVNDLALVHVPRPGQPISFEGNPGEASPAGADRGGLHGPGAIALGRAGEAGLLPATLGAAPPPSEREDAPANHRALVPAATLLAFIKGPPPR